MLSRFLLLISLTRLVVLGHPLSTELDSGASVAQDGVQKQSVPVASVDQALLTKFILYSEFCAAAYCGPQQGQSGGKVACGSAGTCPHVESLDTKIYSTWIGLGSNGATGFVSADNTNKNIVLAMRGSVSMANWIADAKFAQMACDDLVPGAKCNTGFLGFWNESKEKAMEGIKAALAEHPDYPIIITGHSLGGSAAVFAAIDLRKQFKDVTLYTYGQPRAGDEKLSQYVTDQGKNYRVTHTSDAVPKLPPEAGLTGGITGYYRHISPEYWISDGLGNNLTNFRVIEGLTSNDGNAGTGQLKFNIVAHIQYFQTNMYYCALPLPLGILGGQGTKRIMSMEGGSMHGTDVATDLQDLRNMGYGDGILTQEINIAI